MGEFLNSYSKINQTVNWFPIPQYRHQHRKRRHETKTVFVTYEYTFMDRNIVLRQNLEIGLRLKYTFLYTSFTHTHIPINAEVD